MAKSKIDFKFLDTYEEVADLQTIEKEARKRAWQAMDGWQKTGHIAKKAAVPAATLAIGLGTGFALGRATAPGLDAETTDLTAQGDQVVNPY
jgi:anti-sigma-K factor RskA